jgi:murein L,D-transpeptidase YcbB/YkuD
LPFALHAGERPRPALFAAFDPRAAALRAALATDPAGESLAAFYQRRDYRPLWTQAGHLRPEALHLAARVARAADDGLNPAAYGPQRLKAALAAAQKGDAADLARAEIALSTAYGAYVADLHRPPEGAGMAFWDPALPRPLDTPASALQALARGPDLGAGISAALRMHPIYEQLRGRLLSRRSAYGEHDPERPLILANMARARALPGDPGARYILVDAAAQRLWLYEAGRPVDSMAVIVGTSRGQTPQMAGLMRFVQFRPYWNIPADITRDEIAPHVLREGADYLVREDLEVLSDWTPDATVVDPASIDWKAVHDGAVELRVRRRPGAQNILGQVKLMLPNPLGIYLHDTPNKAPFAASRRTLSHGCVRLEDAMRLTRRLVGPAADDPPPGDDVRVDLPSPTPVYIVYFTLAPGVDGLERRPDIYGRDSALIAQVARPDPARSAQARRRPAQA